MSGINTKPSTEGTLASLERRLKALEEPLTPISATRITWPSGAAAISVKAKDLMWGEGAANTWTRGDLHFNSGWAGGVRATIGSRADGQGGYGIMLGTPHVPYRNIGGWIGSFIRYPIDTAVTAYWDVGAYGDAFAIKRNGVSRVTFDTAGNVIAAGELMSNGWIRTLAGQSGYYNNTYGVGISPYAAGVMETYPSGASDFRSRNITATGGVTAVGLLTGYTPGGGWIQTGSLQPPSPQINSSSNTALIFQSDSEVYLNDNPRTVWRAMRASAFIVTSSRESKEEIRKTKYGLKELLDLKVVDFRYTKKHDANQPEGTGVIADDTIGVYPPAVVGGGTGVDYGKFTPLLIQSLQEFVTETRDRLSKLEKVKK